MVWETVPDPRSCVNEASVQLMGFCSIGSETAAWSGVDPGGGALGGGAKT